MKTEIGGPVRRFVAQHIHSAAQLEVLLLLRASRDRDWSVDEVARAHVLSRGMVEQLLDDLCERGLVRRVEAVRYRYEPPADMRRVIDDLADTYRRFPVATRAMIFS